MKRMLFRLVPGLLLIMTVTAVALANYTGPNRTITTTTWQRRVARYLAVYDPSGPGYYSCTLELYFPPDQSAPPPQDVAPFFNPDPLACGPTWPGTCGSTIPCNITKTLDEVRSCTPGQPACTEVTQTTNLPPATVSGTFSCAVPGDNGWCRGGAALDLSASEPLAGEVITLIESASGVLCDPPDAPSVSCAWTGGGEGNYTVTFWAHSSYGDTSGQASAAWKVDGTPPTASFTTSDGTAGANGWYRSGPVTVTATGSDAVSGLASAEVSVDGGPWLASAQVSGDGVHTVDVQARDQAGNVGTGSGTVRIDGTPPSLLASESGPSGLNGWYVGPVDGTATASDALSGLDRIEHRLDGGAWTAGAAATVSGDGTHTLEWRAFDVAGNSAATTRTVRIDATAPVITDSLSGGTAGANGWYTTGPVDLTCTATDATSGLDRIEYRADGGAWGGSASASGEGVHTLECRAFDVAGNSGTASRTVRIDGTPPTISPAESGPAGAGGWYTGAVTASATASDALSGLDRLEHRVDGGAWQAGGSVVVSGDGVHTVEWRATDVAGNTFTTTRTVRIDTVPPSSAFTDPPEGSTTTVSGVFQMRGMSADATSGVAAAEISLDGGATWRPLSLSGGTWTYTWDTRGVPNGVYTVLARARDAAGWLESTARITVIVDNAGPRVDITDRWYIWEAARLSVQDTGTGVERVELTIHGGRFGRRTYRWPPSLMPGEFVWDRRFGRVLAPPGEYRVTLTAWDRVGNMASDEGVVVIPEPATPTATATASPTPTATATETPAPTATAPPPVGWPQAPPPEEPPAPRPPEPAAPAPQPAPEPAAAPAPVDWPFLTLIGLALALSASAVLDRRPRVLRRLAGLGRAYLELRERR